VVSFPPEHAARGRRACAGPHPWARIDQSLSGIVHPRSESRRCCSVGGAIGSRVRNESRTRHSVAQVFAESMSLPPKRDDAFVHARVGHAGFEPAGPTDWVAWRVRHRDPRWRYVSRSASGSGVARPKSSGKISGEPQRWSVPFGTLRHFVSAAWRRIERLL